jgi:hypothetical protein
MSSGRNKKIDDDRLIGFNSVGLSLGETAERLGVHHTTVTHALKGLGIPPADTRRSFMGDVFNGLTEAQQEWLIQQLGPGLSVKDFVRGLIVQKYVSQAR